jgi:hypothetical protein
MKVHSTETLLFPVSKPKCASTTRVHLVESQISQLGKLSQLAYFS